MVASKKPTKKTAKKTTKKVKTAPANDHYFRTHPEGRTVPITLTIPESMVQKIDELAKAERRSRSQIVVNMLRDADPLASLLS